MIWGELLIRGEQSTDGIELASSKIGKVHCSSTFSGT